VTYGEHDVNTNEEMERLDLRSANPLDERLTAIAALFPEAMRDGKVDCDALRRSLGDWVDPGPERFGLTWPGKAECMKVIQEPSIGTLVPMPDESVDWDSTQNVIIEGENLEVLKLLQKAYYGKVKMIYIDPPYNTGKEFIYPDNFKEGLADYLKYSGQVDDEGLKLSANAETDGRYHSKWLSMMYPRLFLARNLLREDGAIFVSIDDHEVHNLRALMNEIFGEENFVAEIAVVNNLKGRNDRDNIATSHEYLLIYERGDFESRGVALTAEQASEYRHTAEDGRSFQWRDLRKRGGADTRAARPNLYFPVWVDPESGSVAMEASAVHSIQVFPTKSDGAEGCWRWGRDKVASSLSELRASKVESKDRWNISYRVFLQTDEGLRTAKPKSVWTGPQFSTDAATKKFRALVPDIPDMTPKPVGLIASIIEQTMEEGDLCLDFFAGSGTTGHAVYEESHRRGAALSFILVQLPEPLEHTRFDRLSAVTRERVRLAGARLADSDPQLLGNNPDLGFRAFRLAPSNFAVWRSARTDADAVAQQLTMSVEHVLEGSTAESMLTELLLKAGFPLTAAVEEKQFAGIAGYSVADGALVVCLSDELTIEAFEAMVELNPAMILVLDRGFGGSDELKVNALQTVRARNQREGTDIALKVV
jgi:adenine-specific DNA-methyltransferase